MDTLQEFLNWYLAPWRRLGRKPFNTTFFIVSLVGMAISISGMAAGAGGMLRPLMGVMDTVGGVQQAAQVPSPGAALGGLNYDEAAMTRQMNGLLGGGGASAAPAAASAIPWGALLNDLLLLALAPLVLMRLRDMGKRGTTMWVLFGMTYATTGVEMLEMVGPSFGLIGTMLAALSFVMWGWLCMAKSQKEKDEKRAAESTLLMTARQPFGMVQADDHAAPPRTDPYATDRY